MMNSYDTFLIIGLFARMRGKHLSAATVEAILDELSTSEPDDQAAQAPYPAGLTARLQEMEQQLRAEYMRSLAADIEAQAERFKQELPALVDAYRRSSETVQ